MGCQTCKEVSRKGVGPRKEKNVSFAPEWTECQVSVSAKSSEGRESKLSLLRGKIYKHVKSRAHEIACDITASSAKDPVGKAVMKLATEDIQKTAVVFRSVYYLAKKNRPFTDHPSLIELQRLNGVDCGIILHSRYSATNITDCIAQEMRQKILENVISSGSKFSVVIDESTTLSNKTALVVYLKTCVSEKNEEPEFLFLSLKELSAQTAEVITDTLLQLLSDNGFTEEFLQENWLSLVSDGASVMIGSRSGVATRLRIKYPQLFVWHCLNHRLELSVGDVLREVTEVNHFQSFMDSLYSIYSKSPKNQQQVREISIELDSELMKIGRVFSIRWISSSYRTVSAVWRSFQSLNKHFQDCSEDIARDSKDRQRFRGLKAKISSKEFLLDLALMHDCLAELAELSLELQQREMTIPKAHKQLSRTIRVLASFKESPGDKLKEAELSAEEGVHEGVTLSTSKKFVPIKRDQFLQSLVDNMKSRLVPSESETVLKDLEIFDDEIISAEIGNDIRAREDEVRRLALRFRLNVRQCQRGFRAYADGEYKNAKILPLIKAVKSIPCSSAECERGFSAMNSILTEYRSNLTLTNVENLMFIRINCPPVALFDPTAYVEKWLCNHRSAIDRNSRRVKAEKHESKIFWDVL